MGWGFHLASLCADPVFPILPRTLLIGVHPVFPSRASLPVWHTFSRSDLLWRRGRRAATFLNVATQDPPEEHLAKNASLSSHAGGWRSRAVAWCKKQHIKGDPGPNLLPPDRNTRGGTDTMSNPLPPYSTFRTDNKVRQAAAGGTGGIRRLGRPEKAAEEFSTVRPFFGGCTDARKIPRPERGVRRSPSPRPGGSLGRLDPSRLLCIGLAGFDPFRRAVCLTAISLSLSLRQ